MQNISFAISLIAFVIGVLNYLHARVGERRKREADIHDFLYKTRQCLKGPDGFTLTKDTGKVEEAESLVKRAIALYPRHPIAIRWAGHILSIRGDKEGARSKFLESLRLDPCDPDTHHALGLVLDGEAALASYKKAIELNRNNAHAQFSAAIQLNSFGRFDEALKYAEKAYNLQPSNSNALVIYAQLLKKTATNGDSALVEQLLRKAVSFDPSSVDALVMLGSTIAVKPGKWEEGIAYIGDAMRRDPLNDYPYAMMAALHADRREPEKALEFNSRAIELNPARRIANDPSQGIAQEMRRILEERESMGPPAD